MLDTIFKRLFILIGSLQIINLDVLLLLTQKVILRLLLYSLVLRPCQWIIVSTPLPLQISLALILYLIENTS